MSDFKNIEKIYFLIDQKSFVMDQLQSADSCRKIIATVRDFAVLFGYFFLKNLGSIWCLFFVLVML